MRLGFLGRIHLGVSIQLICSLYICKEDALAIRVDSYR